MAIGKWYLGSAATFYGYARIVARTIFRGSLLPFDVWSDQRNWLSQSVCERDCCGSENGDDIEILCNQDGKIESLVIRQNRLLWPITSEIKALSMLELIDLCKWHVYNSLNVWMNDCLLSCLFTSAGNSLRGSLPSAIGLLSLMTRVDMHDTQLTGRFPSDLGNFVRSSLRALAVVPWCTLTPPIAPIVDQTALTDQLPLEIGKWSLILSFSLCKSTWHDGFLWNLQVSYTPNSFKTGGTVPKEMFQITSLSFLYLDDNILTWPLPEVVNWTHLQSLSLCKWIVDFDEFALLGTISLTLFMAIQQVIACRGPFLPLSGHSQSLWIWVCVHWYIRPSSPEWFRCHKFHSHVLYPCSVLFCR